MNEVPELIVKEFTKKILEKYGSLVKSVVLVGSVARGKLGPDSDIDTLVIIDDTDESLGSASGILEAVSNDLEEVAKEFSDKLSVHPFALTEFVEYASSGHPIVYNFIKEGVPIFDEGFFTPWKRLLEAGKIRCTRESLGRLVKSAVEKLANAKTVKLLMLAENCHDAMVNSTQAVLMSMGLEPRAPSELHEPVVKRFVRQGLLEEEYANWLKEIVQLRKEVVRRKLLEVRGDFVDEWIGKAEAYVEKMCELLHFSELWKKEKVIERAYEVMVEAVAMALKALHGLPKDLQIDELEKHLGTPVRDAFKREFVDSKLVDEYYLDVWRGLEKLKREVVDERDLKRKVERLERLDGDEVEHLRELVRSLINKLHRVTRRGLFKVP
jgi:predicted nucleotidyltransferase